MCMAINLGAEMYPRFVRNSAADAFLLLYLSFSGKEIPKHFARTGATEKKYRAIGGRKKKNSLQYT